MEQIATCTARLIANPVAHKLKADRSTRSSEGSGHEDRSRSRTGSRASPAGGRRAVRARDPRRGAAGGDAAVLDSPSASTVPSWARSSCAWIRTSWRHRSVCWSLRCSTAWHRDRQCPRRGSRAAARAGRGGLPQGHRVEIVEAPVRRAAIYVPGGEAPYPSTVVMGAVTARAAGVDEIVVCAPPGPGGCAPGDPRRLRPVRGSGGVPDGWRPGHRRPRVRHGVRAARGCDRGTRKAVRAGGQAPGGLDTRGDRRHRGTQRARDRGRRRREWTRS